MGAGRVFAEDLKQALRAWKADPRLPILSLWLWLLTSVPTFLRDSVSLGVLSALNLVLIPVMILVAGYFGTERIWYLRAWRGKTLRPAEIFSFSWFFLGRFFALALLITIPFLPFAFLWGNGLGRTSYLVVAAIVGFLIDFALTFATPALAYSTASAVEALGISLKMIREYWPRSAFFAIVPPTAALFTLRSLPMEGVSLSLHVGLTVVGVLLNLLFKGATAAFYLRFHPDIPNDGAAHLRNEEVREIGQLERL